MTKEGSTKIINFLTPGAGVLVLGRHRENSENAFSLKIFLSTLGHDLDKLSAW